MNCIKIIYKIIICTIITLMGISAYGQQATWIYYPGDYDIWLSNKMQNRRTERGTFFPPFWKMDNHYVLVEFSKKFTLSEPEIIEINAEGRYNVKLNGKMIEGSPKNISIPSGNNTLYIKVYNQQYVPSIFVKGKTVFSDSSWNTTIEDKEWIDESGKASDLSATTYLKADSWNFNTPKDKPSQFALPTKPKKAKNITQKGNTYMVDFGEETFGFVKLHGIKGNGEISLYYGESIEEALSLDYCETLDRITLNHNTAKNYTLANSKAFRYVNIHLPKGMSLESVSMLYEYLPVTKRGYFKCSDELINKIWDISEYTFELNNREFFLDGIKRDRWIWSGDAAQSFLMNYYLNFDNHAVKRTLNALRGKDPVTSHINTIMDYSFYWFIGIYDYYLFSGDKSYIETHYARMQSLMDFCLGRVNKNGMMEGMLGDWVYLDWAPMSKKGEVSFEQLLFCRSLETMAMCAEMLGDNEGESRYSKKANELKKKLFDAFWDENKGAFIHNRVNNKAIDDVTRYTNMFAIFFDYVDDKKTQMIKENVLLNNQVQAITTPYMRFYELEALCALNEHQYVLDEIRDYWGGMLENGATSFWEKYDPTESGKDHYSMYGRPFGKSLCHAWGASPIYLLGKYYLGIKPTSPGYKTYTIKPVLGDLQWIEGKVPTPEGDIYVYANEDTIKIETKTSGIGTLKIKSNSKPSCKNANITKTNKNEYELKLVNNTAYEVKYSYTK